ncbi:MAG: hypothetical protein DI534_11935 [Leifsonia xyli]|nr:MAG: hypothetical protein DI534_11935 [Leifsonia xyli]
MPTTPAQAEALTGIRSATTYRGRDVVAAQAVAAALRPTLATHLRALESPGGALAVIRTTPTLTRVPLAELRADLVPPARDALTLAAEHAPDGIRHRRARATLDVLADDALAGPWLRTLAAHVRDTLPELDPVDREALLATEAEARRARTTRRPRPDRAERTAREAATRADADAELRELLARWLPTWDLGRYPLPTLWAEFERQRPAVARRWPAAATAGRTRFYRAVTELAADAPTLGTARRIVATVRNAGAHLRELVLDRVHLTTWAAQRDYLASYLARRS